MVGCLPGFISWPLYALTELVGAVAGAVQAVFSAVLGPLSRLLLALVTPVLLGLGPLLGPLKSMGGALFSFVRFAWLGLITVLSAPLTVVRLCFTLLLKLLLPLLENSYVLISNVVGVPFKWVMPLLQAVWNVMRSSFAMVRGLFSSAAPLSSAALAGSGGATLLKRMQDMWSTIFRPVKGVVMSMYNGMMMSITKLLLHRKSLEAWLEKHNLHWWVVKAGAEQEQEEGGAEGGGADAADAPKATEQAAELSKLEQQLGAPAGSQGAIVALAGTCALFMLGWIVHGGGEGSGLTEGKEL